MEKTDREKQLPGTPVDEGDGVGATTSSSLSSQPPNATSNNPLYCSYVDGQFTYKDPNTNNQYVWNEDEKKWVVKAREGGGGVPAAAVDSNKLADGEKNRESSGGGEMERGSVVASSPGTSQVQFDGENYTYTDQDGTVFLWDSAKAAWFPKDVLRSPTTEDNVVPQAFRLPPSPPDLSSCTTSNQTLGFFNPNYSTQLTSPTTTTTTTACGEQVGGGDSSGGGSRRFYYASLSPTTMGVNDQPGLFLSPDDQVNNNDQVPEETTLPPGWEKHDDSNGPYYWHIKSGTIQRERPSINSPVTTSIVNNPALMIPGGMSGFVRRSNTMGAVASAGGGTNNAGGGAGNLSDKRRSWVNYLEDTSRAEQLHQQHQYQQQREDIAASRVLQPVSNIPAYEFDKHTLKFAAVSLGCLSISEEDLTPERSSRAVSKVIAELTNPGCKGEHRERVNGSELASRIWTHTENASSSQMYLELTDSHLRVKVHRDSTSPLTVLEQPIHSIRVWGVGREDPRDFAFVAREKQTRQFLCHVFRLEMYARPLASSLRDACKKIMIERNARSDRGASTKRPTTLGIKKPAESARGGGGGGGGPGAISGVGGLLFPTPMDEPRKVIKAFYLGSKAVCKPTGMDVLNAAIDTLRVGGVDRVPVLVSVAPSVIGITSTESPPKVELEVRVRFLSFMGIGSDIRTCGIIIHTARDDFEAHCFYSVPSTGALCKAIEAACVLRYQKCLDAHTHHGGGGPATNNTSETVKQRSNSMCDGGGVGCGGGGSGSTATSPKSASVIASATASNLASALKTVFSSFGKAKSEEK